MKDTDRLSPLLEKIKKEGVEEGLRLKQSIEEKAQDEARSILAQARAQADKIVEDARAERQRQEAAFATSMKNAGRDLVASVRHQVELMAERLLLQELTKALDPSFVQTLIVKALESFLKDGQQDILLMVNPDDLEEMEQGIMQALGGQMAAGVTLNPVKSVQAGFRLALENGRIQYDVTDTAIAEMLAAFLTPKVSAFLTEKKEK
jgi:V/A-type H+-transporting ATPase subunit E